MWPGRRASLAQSDRPLTGVVAKLGILIHPLIITDLNPIHVVVIGRPPVVIGNSDLATRHDSDVSVVGCCYAVGRSTPTWPVVRYVYG